MLIAIYNQLECENCGSYFMIEPDQLEPDEFPVCPYCKEEVFLDEEYKD